MLLSALAVLVSVPGTQPVRLTLDPSTVASGDRVRVFVDVATAGHLLVLRVAADGRVAVVFPFDPVEGTFVDAGAYEVRPPGDPTAFVALGPVGTGIVVAALAQVPYEFDEFVRGGAWNAAALAAAGTHSDGTGKLLDIVQRMLGPEYFNYDVATYTVIRPVTEGPVTTASYGFGSCWGYGCAWGGWYVPWGPRPCLYRAFGCWPGPSFCGDLADWRWCAGSCWTAIDCWPKPKGKAVAGYRRGVPILATTPPRPVPTERSGPAPYRPLERSATPGSAGFAGASRAVPLASGRQVATPSSRPRLPGTTRRPLPQAPQRATQERAPLPERVPWPTSVLSRGEKTAAPAVRPREARLKQSASRPPLPPRVAWPTATRPVSRPASGLKPVAATPPSTVTPASIGPKMPLGFPRSTGVKAPSRSGLFGRTPGRTGTVAKAAAQPATSGGRALAAPRTTAGGLISGTKAGGK